jgi:hypothetical protein
VATIRLGKKEYLFAFVLFFGGKIRVLKAFGD